MLRARHTFGWAPPDDEGLGIRGLAQGSRILVDFIELIQYSDSTTSSGWCLTRHIRDFLQGLIPDFLTKKMSFMDPKDIHPCYVHIYIYIFIYLVCRDFQEQDEGCPFAMSGTRCECLRKSHVIQYSGPGNTNTEWGCIVVVFGPLTLILSHMYVITGNTGKNHHRATLRGCQITDLILRGCAWRTPFWRSIHTNRILESMSEEGTSTVLPYTCPAEQAQTQLPSCVAAARRIEKLTVTASIS